MARVAADRIREFAPRTAQRCEVQMSRAPLVLHDHVAPLRARRLEAELDGRARQAGKAHLIPPAAPGEQAQDRRPHGGRLRPIGQQPVMLDEQLVERRVPAFMEMQGARRQDAMTPFVTGQEHAEPDDLIAAPRDRRKRLPIGRQVAQPAPDPTPGLEEGSIAPRLERPPGVAESLQVDQRLEAHLNTACRRRTIAGRDWARHGAMIVDDEA